MARPRKDGRRATGIQSKKGYLYIVTSNTTFRNGAKVTEKVWTATGLSDTPENVKKASEARERLCGKDTSEVLDKNITVQKYVDHYMAQKKRQIADTTYSAYLYRAKLIQQYFGKEERVRSLNKVTVERFLDALFTRYGLQPRTVKDTKAFLCGLLDQAVKDGIIVYNAVNDVVINKTLARQYAQLKTEEEEFFSYDEAQLFLDRVKNHELYELFYVTVFFGLRREEVLGLRWSALDFKNKTMRINHTVTKGTAVNRLDATKTASSAREYPLTDDQIEMFKALKKKEAYNRSLCGRDYYDSDYVFKHSDGTLYYPDYPSKTFTKLVKRIPELPHEITFHGLRKSCVSILIHQGMDVKSIQKWVGHADIDTTLKIYAKVKDKEAKKSISDAMNNVIELKNYKA